MSEPQISLIIPLFNEEAVFDQLVERLVKVLNDIPYATEVVLVDDGSSDQTLTLMESIAMKDHRFQSIALSRNYGHQIAISAGLHHARATEAVMILDGDLQDPPELVSTFFEKYKEGYDIVYAVRKKRKEAWLKRSLYFLFYRILRTISYIDVPLDSGDFSLISRRVVDILNTMPERSRYIRGMRSWVGFRQIGIEYDRDQRAGGKPKYSYAKLLKLAYDGIFNFSDVPIKFLTLIGFSCIVLAAVYFIYVIARNFMVGDVPVGFTALLFMIILFGGVNLVSIGILGEYLIRIFFQVKDRPLYIVSNHIMDQKQSGQH